MIRKILFLLFLELVILGNIEAEQVYKVTKVYDGDTITALNGSSGDYFRIRFKCIDAPEMKQITWGEISRNRLNEIIPVDSYIQLKNVSLDIYGRTLAEVFTIDGLNINEKMIREGYCCFYPFQNGCYHYRPLEDQAKQENLNFWNDPDFVLPWDFRRNNTWTKF